MTHFVRQGPMWNIVEPARLAARFMNIRPESLKSSSFTVEMVCPKDSKLRRLYTTHTSNNPLVGRTRLDIGVFIGKKEGMTAKDARWYADNEDDPKEILEILKESRENWTRETIMLEPSMIVSSSMIDDTVVLRKDDMLFTFKRDREARFNWY